MNANNVKNLLPGGLPVVVVLYLTGAEPFFTSQYIGRYQIEANESYARVLDSATGQVWSTLAIGSGDIISPIDPNSPFSLPKDVVPSESR